PVPERARGLPHGALERHEAEELLEEPRLVADVQRELLVDRRDLLGDAMERAHGARVEDHRVLAKARRAVDPRVGEHTARGQPARERGVALEFRGIRRRGGLRGGHASLAIESAVATYVAASSAARPSLRSTPMATSSLPPRSDGG